MTARTIFAAGPGIKVTQWCSSPHLPMRCVLLRFHLTGFGNLVTLNVLAGAGKIRTGLILS